MANTAANTSPAIRTAATIHCTCRDEAAGAGIKVTVDQVPATGPAVHYTYTANYDGKDAPVVGNSAKMTHGTRLFRAPPTA